MLQKKAPQLDPRATVRAAIKKIERHLDAEHPEHVHDALRKALRLAEIVEEEKARPADRYTKAIAALQYLVDPWDAIPDSIPEFGLVDDAYVIELAERELGAPDTVEVRVHEQPGARPPSHHVETSQARRADSTRGAVFPYQELPNGAGQHLAGRAKRLGLLTPYTRRALFQISNRWMRQGRLTERQEIFLSEILIELADDGLMDQPCDNSPCNHCSTFADLASRFRPASNGVLPDVADVASRIFDILRREGHSEVRISMNAGGFVRAVLSDDLQAETSGNLSDHDVSLIIELVQTKAQNAL